MKKSEATQTSRMTLGLGGRRTGRSETAPVEKTESLGGWDGPQGSLDRDLSRILVSCKRTALVVAGLCDELRRHGGLEEELDAMVWAAHRVVEWVASAQLHFREDSLLRHLAEAACSNMALRGLAYEYSAVRSQQHRLSGLVLNQSRKVGALLAQAAELSGRSQARRLGVGA